MLGNFTYCNPTRLYFGKDSLENLEDELKKYGKNVVLIYGGGSIKKNGIYDQVTAILRKSGKAVAEISGVMPNPTLKKLLEGVEIARAHKADFCWRWAAAAYAIMQRRYPFPYTVRGIFGTNIS